MSVAMQMQPSFAGGPRTVWPRSYLVAAAALIATATVIAYLPALGGRFIWDDDAHVTRAELRSAHGLYRIWFDVGATQQYYPLLHSVFWFQHKLWGDRPVGYHAVNIALHVVAAVLVMLIVRRLLSDRGVPWADSAAILSAAVFALHPVHVESVAWITELKNTLSAVFYLSAMLVYLGFDVSRSCGGYALATLLFAMALLSKPVTVTLPPALLVIFWWQRGRLSWRRDFLPLLPWFAMSVASGLFSAWVERDVIGAEGEAFTLLGAQRLLLPGRVVWFYLSKLFWPAELIFVYPRWDVNGDDWRQWVYPISLIVLLVLLSAYSRRYRAPLAAMLFFVGSLFPVLGFFNVYLFLYTYVADHFQYLPSLGVIVLVCAAAAGALSRLRVRGVRTGLSVALPAMLGVLTFRQCRMYADSQTLYEATLAKNPDCWMAYNNLGIVLKNKGLNAEAIEHYKKALELRPDYPEAYNNLGVILSEAGRYDDAIAAFERALRRLPRYPDAMVNLISTMIDAGRLPEAIERSREALPLFRGNARFHINLGIALRKSGRHRESVEHLEAAARLGPNLAEAHANLAVAYEATGRLPEAIAAGEQAMRIARANGQVSQAEQIDSWLQSRRAQLGGGTPGP